MTAYQEFLASKRVVVPANGPTVEAKRIHSMLFSFQRDLVRWSIRKGRAAIFADTGLGKTFMQLEWARLISESEPDEWGNRARPLPALIVAPLSVARQTIGEARKIGLEVIYSRDGSAHPLTITNYEILDKFDPGQFGAVVLDESSILKSLDGKTRAKLTEMFVRTPYRLCCTATPAPNDIAEIANHAEFLGIMSRVDMLATFFVHDDDGWRLKKHAEDPFYRWLASWGMSVRRPSDLGYSDEGYILPPLKIEPLWVETEFQPDDALFWTGLKGITDRSRVRKGTMQERVLACSDMVNADDSQWLIWCGLNEESTLLTQQIPDAVEVSGDQDAEQKAQAFEEFQDGKIRVIVTKPKIGGFGMNFQNCHKMAFVGLSDSWEAYYQCVRRCYRFGQRESVEAYIVLSDAERSIYDNVMRKEREATDMSEKLVANVREFERAEISAGGMEFQYETKTEAGERWKLMLGDSTERLIEVPDESVDVSVFSPPFMSLYTYSPTERDLGNTRGEEQFFRHFGFIINHLLRMTKPGRNCCVHVAQVPAMLVRDGYIGLKDFRGKTISAFEAAGWIYHGEVCIDKDPQAQAIRTKSKALLFTQLRKDSSWLRPALADYILVFRKPGDNTVPIQPDLTNDEWIEWARPIWYGISESDTLNIAEGRDSKDERHICPLQLGTIERCIRLWSNKGEMVCSPFGGIGSEGYMAVKLGRQFVGCELKRSYFEAAVRNLKRVEDEREQETLFSGI
jgi:DNA modification methylase/superfamily II DNA or RNA helicase